MKLSFLVLLAVNFLSVSRLGESTCTHNAKKGPILAALLDLHSDEQCSVVNIKGLQQLAALEATLKQVNNDLKQEGIEIFLQVFDTCSSKKVALTSTLKALVSAKQTCLFPPLFLGFIGPEKVDSLRGVQNLTRVFNTAHLLPYNLHTSPLDDRIFHLTKYPVEKHGEAAMLVMSKLNWKSVTVMFEESDIARAEAEQLVGLMAENSSICLGENIFHFNSTSTFKQALANREDTDGILVMLESVELAHSILKQVENVTSQVVLSVSKTGLPSWSLPLNNHTLFLLQLISSTPVGDLSKSYDAFLLKIDRDHQLEEFKKLCRQYGSTQCDDSLISNSLENNQDWTVNLMQYGLMLFSSALRVAHYTKCKPSNTTLVKVHYKPGICPSLASIPIHEWNSILAKSSLFVKSPSSSAPNKKLTFGMDVPPSFNLYTTHRSDKLYKIGYITNGRLLGTGGVELPGVKENRGIGERCNSAKFPREPNEDDWADDFFSGLFDFHLDPETYETLVIIGSLATGIILTMLCIIYVVYRSFRVSTGRSQRHSYSENSSISPRGSIDSR